MKWLNTNVGPANRSLEQAPKVFQSVCVDIAANVFPRVVNRFMDVILIQPVVRLQGIGKNMRAFLDVLADCSLNGLRFGVDNVFQFRVALSFQEAHDDGLAAATW